MLIFAAALLGALHLGAAALPPRIPLPVLFGNPVKANPLISPDGKRLAYLAPDEKNVLQVWVQTIGRDDARQVTRDPKRGIQIHMWAYAPDTLLYLQDHDGDENFHIYAVDVKSDKIRDLTPYPNVQAQIVGLDRHYPDELLAALNRRDPRVHDVYRISLKRHEVKLDTESPGDVLGWQADPQFRIRAAQTALPDGGMEVRYRADETSPWRTVVRWGPDDADGRVVDFTADGKSLWLISSEGRNTTALVKRNLATGQETVAAADPRADVTDPHEDVGGVIVNPLSHQVEAVSFEWERVAWMVVDPKVAADLTALKRGAPGDFTVTSRDRDLKKWVVSYTNDTRSRAYYLYDRSTKQLTHLFDSRPALAKYRLAPMKPVVIHSRDGLDLVSYLTLPVGVEPKNLPMLLDVHGGPWGRDSWGYNPEVQWLANRGYAVLQVNFRASTGFGKKFLHAGDREWAGKMHNDLIDAVHWAALKGVADPMRIGIYGESYGGYAALVGAAFTPDVFACAIDGSGPSNLVTLLKSIPPYWEPMKRMLAVRVGDVEKEPQFLESRSPLFKADQIRIPLLIVQGANDPRVKTAEAEQIVAAVRNAGKPMEYLLFPDEGHGLVRPANRLKFYAAAEVFLARYLSAPAGEGKG